MKLVDQLPRALRSDPFVGQLLDVVGTVNDTVIGHADALEWLADPQLTPDRMARWMTRWVGWDFDESMSTEFARTLLSAFGSSFAQRTTIAGIQALLARITGRSVTVEDDGGVFAKGGAPTFTGRVAIVMASAGPLSHKQLVALLDQELPADVAYTVTVDGVAVATDRTDRGHPDHGFDYDWTP